MFGRRAVHQPPQKEHSNVQTLMRTIERKRAYYHCRHCGSGHVPWIFFGFFLLSVAGVLALLYVLLGIFMRD
jgi:hypothetical protein